MATWTQWSKNAVKGKKPAQVTWVCGDQAVLVSEVVDYIRGRIDAHEVDRVTLVAGQDPEVDIWAAVNQYPIEPAAPRLVIVRDAQRIKEWAPLLRFMDNARLLPTNHLVLISTEPDFAAMPKKEKGDPTVLLPHMVWIRDKNMGDLIRCARPTAEPARKNATSDLVRWVQLRQPMPPLVANHLLARAGGDLGKVANVCAKRALFAGEMTASQVDELCSESPADDFVDSLLRLDKPRALRAAEVLPAAEISATLGLLDWNLELLTKIHKGVRQRKTADDLRRQDDIPSFLVSALYPVAKHYDAARRQRCRAALALVDGSGHHGQQVDGALEALVALW